jgi:signal transduction histidine kinase
MARVIEEVLSSVRPRALARSVEIGAAVSIDAPVSADRLRSRQILHNLLSNTIRFTPKGGSVEVKVARSTRLAEISISDRGIGIPQEQQQAIFDKFYDVRAGGIQRAHEGTGLGLAITKRHLEQDGGTISLSSQRGKVTPVTFTLPLEQPL